MRLCPFESLLRSNDRPCVVPSPSGIDCLSWRARVTTICRQRISRSKAFTVGSAQIFANPTLHVDLALRHDGRRIRHLCVV